MGRAKDERKNADIAAQREKARQMGNEILAQLVPGSREYQEFQALITEITSTAPGEPITFSNGQRGYFDTERLQNEGRRYTSEFNARIARGEPATALEARTDQSISGLRDAAAPNEWEQDLYDSLSGGQIDTPFGEALRYQVGRAGSTEIDDSVFKNALKLVEDRVNTEYAGRGLLGGGLRLEGLGRAGVEAAIAEAMRQDKLRQEAFLNTNSIYNQGQNLRNRQIGVESDLVNVQLGRESNLTGILDSNTNRRMDDMNDLLERSTDRSQDVSDFYTEKEINDRNAAIKAGLQVGGAVGSMIPGVGPAFAAVSSAASSAYPSAGQINTAQQTQGTSQPLSRQSSGGLDMQQLLDLLKKMGRA